MKLLKPTVGLLGLVLMFSCSSDDSISDPNLGNTPKSNLEIKAVAIGTSANAKSVANVEVAEFFINIKNIEFDFADGFGDGNSSGSDDDYLTFEELPSEIVAYLEDNYPNDPFCKGELEDDDDDEDEDPYAYEIELQSGTEIYFRADFSIYAIESDDDGCDFDDDGDDNDESYGSDDDFELNGPFELSLTSEVITVINVEIPVGEYEEVEFEMDRSTNPNSDLYQKSILMRGKISGTEFKFFHTFSEEFEVDYEDAGQNLVITEENNNTVVFEFDLTSVFNSVDLSGATDGNENGVIEISPEDNDGNRQLANRIKNAIKTYVDLLDD
jgi:hypothetical protein